MNKPQALVAAIMTLACTSHALPAYEGFDYTNALGTALTGLNGGTGWLDAYPSTTVYLTNGLVFPGINSSTATKAMAFGSSMVLNAGRSWAPASTNPPDGIYWYSFIAQPKGPNGRGTFVIFRANNSANGQDGFGLRIDNSGGRPLFKLWNPGSWSVDVFLGNYDQPHFVLGKLVYTNGVQALQTMWVYDSSSAVPTNEPTSGGVTQFGVSVTDVAKALPQMSGRGFGDNTLLVWDEVRIGNTFADVISLAPIQMVVSTPPNGAVFYPVSSNLVFDVTSGTSAIPTNGIKLTLNGVDVSSGLSFVDNGGGASWTVTYSGLVANTFYSASATATNLDGQIAAKALSFDTLESSTTELVEAEDYNYSAGLFIDNPAPNGYFTLAGTAGIDYEDTTQFNFFNQYRLDDVDIDFAGDTVRPDFTNALATDFKVSNLKKGEWLNYTRTVTAGSVVPYLRASASAAQLVRLDLVTGDRTLSNQTTIALGTFNVTGAYQYIPLRDALGNVVAVTNAPGDVTYRLTPVSADNNLSLNFFLSLPTNTTSVLPPYLAAAVPASGNQSVVPFTTVEATLINRSTSVSNGTVSLTVDGVSVTPTINTTAQGVTLAYTPPAPFLSGSSHTNRIVFSDTAGTLFTNQWTFKVVNYATIPVEYASPDGAGSNPGFALKTVKTTNTLDIPGNVASRELHLAGLLPTNGLPYVYTNEAAGPNLDGSATNTYLNFVTLGTNVTPASAGWFTVGNGYADQDFPNMDTVTVFTSGAQHYTMQAIAYIPLTAGFHQLGCRRDDGFRLTVGPVAADTNLVAIEFNANGADAATEGWVYVPTSGVYAFRLLYWQAGGGASLELYYIDQTTGNRVLFNDPVVASPIPAYLTRNALPPAPVVTAVSPANGANNVSQSPAISATIVNTAQSVNTNTLQLSIDGVPVSGSLGVSNTPIGIVVTYAAGQLALANNAPHTASLSFTDTAAVAKTNTWTFNVSVPAPTVTFTGSPTSGFRPLTVTFTNTLTQSLTTMFWNFGDGSTTNIAPTNRVVFTYRTEGTNTVLCTVTGPSGSGSQTRTNYIIVRVPPQPAINQVVVSNSNLTLSGSGGITNAGYNYYLATATNVAAPGIDWTILSTNPFAAGGLFTNTVPVTPGEPQRYFRIQMP